MNANAEVTALNSRVQQFISQPRKVLIDGRWVAAKSGETFDVFNPATGQRIARAAACTAADVDSAVAAARKAFDQGPWPRMSPSERGRIIWKIGDLLLENLEELAQLESLDNGKPITVARAADVPLAADLFHYMAGWATKIEGNTISLSVPYTPGAEYHAYTRREPIGVVAQIIPWNFPLLMAAWKLGPALASGCTIILKVAEETPLSGLRLAELCQEAGLPDGVLNVLTGFGEPCGAPLAAHNRVDKVAFTGSTEVGKLIVKAAANDLKKVTLELGGKSPNIILEDADLELAIPGAANAIFFNQGQCCCAGSRLFIHERNYDGSWRASPILPRASGSARGSIHGRRWVRSCRRRNSTVCLDIYAPARRKVRALCGGQQMEGEGYFVAPTVLVDTSNDMKVYREEIFGPVVTASRSRASTMTC